MVALAGIASSVAALGADDVVETVSDTLAGDKSKETKNEDGKYVYINLLSDIGAVSCPGINPIDYVQVNVLGETVATVDFYDSGDETGSGDVNVPGETGINGDGILCIGGAKADMPRQTTDAWDVWTTDLIWDRIMDENILEADVFRVAGYARMDIQYDYNNVARGDSDAGEELCVPMDDDQETLVVCQEPGVGTWTARQAINNFGFCGQGIINADGGYRDPWDVMDNDNSMPGALADRTHKAVSKVVFIDGPATFLFDCAQGGDATKETYNLAVGLVNQVTCSDQQDPDLLTLVHSVTCFFGQQPVGGSNCLGDGISVPGIIGTIGWNHDDDANKCHEDAFDQPINDFQGGATNVNNFPELPGCDAAGDLQDPCEEALGTVDELVSVLGVADLFIGFEGPARVSSYQTCDGTVDYNCEEGAYTWCSANDGGPGYVSQNDSCMSGYQAQPRYGHFCTLWIAKTPPSQNTICIA